MIRRILHRLAHGEEGVALVMALAIMLVASLTTAGLLVAGTANQRESLVSNNAKQAFELAQEAFAYDEGMLYSDGENGITPPTTRKTLPTQLNGGTGSYWLTQPPSGSNVWSLTANGTMGNVTRTITANATPPSTTTVTEDAVWNYLYTDSTSSCLSISGGVTVSIPILTRGNVCVTSGGHFTGSALQVGGTLTDTGGSNIGTSSAKVSTVQIGGCTAWNSSGSCTTTTSTGCTVQPSSTYTVAAGTSYCDGTHSPLYASSVTGSLSVTPEMPCIGQSSTLDPQCTSTTATWSTLNTVYNTQKAATKTGCPTNLLDNDTTLNNSLSASTVTAAMFPSNSSYDCKIVSGGSTIGELKWNAVGQYCGNGTLTVSGIVYIDGSVNLGCGWKVQYSGQATIYFTGTVEQSGGTQLCGITNCTASWDPDVNGIIFIAGCWSNSTGSSLVSSKCVYITGGSTAQWGAYATTAYQVDGGSSNMGPVLANSATVGGGASTLIPFHQFPPGTPLTSYPVQVAGTPPEDWSG